VKAAAQLLSAWMLLSGLGCDNIVEVNGTITVPPDVQMLFSSTKPGRVIFYAARKDVADEFARGTAIFLCDPRPDPIVVPIRASSVGCMREADFEVLVDQVPDEWLGSVKCGEGEEGAPFVPRDRVLAHGTQRVFDGERAGDCKSGRATVAVTVTLAR
jgi:hypothetical protein